MMSAAVFHTLKVELSSCDRDKVIHEDEKCYCATAGHSSLLDQNSLRVMLCSLFYSQQHGPQGRWPNKTKEGVAIDHGDIGCQIR